MNFKVFKGHLKNKSAWVMIPFGSKKLATVAAKEINFCSYVKTTTELKKAIKEDKDEKLVR